MKTIKISKKVKGELGRLTIDDSSMDKVVNQLLDVVEADLKNYRIDDGLININLQDDTFKRLNSLKRSDKDSYTKLLSDAISLYRFKS